MNETLIRVDNIAKKFCKNLNRSLWYGFKDAAAEMMGRDHGTGGRLRRDEFWALRDISFEVKRGECMGLLGRNGAGKSTLLKMLNGLLKPDAGRIEMHGRVGALIELGAGFNPILTGRENVYVNGAVLGFSKREIDRKFDAIVDFAEMEDFIDTPVKNYSSGMKVRLGFAVAAQLEPDVLLIDEVLAVGDVGFKIKCYNEIYRLVKNAAVIFVSHSMPQIGKICNRGIVLKNGMVASQSQNIAEAIGAYNDLFQFSGITWSGSGRAELASLSITSGKDEPHTAWKPTQRPVSVVAKHGAPCYIDLQIQLHGPRQNLQVSLSFIDMDQRLVAQCHCIANINYRDGTYYVRAEIEALLLAPGKYALCTTVWGATAKNIPQEVLVEVRNIANFHVTGDRYSGAAPIQFAANWHFREGSNCDSHTIALQTT